MKICRKMKDWEWYSNVNTCHLFLHCIISANWKDGKFEGVEVPMGSFVTSYPKLSEQTGLSIKAVRVALEHLKNTGEVAVERHPKFSVISIKNYSQYQERGSQGAVEGQSNGSRGATIEEFKRRERREDSISNANALDRPSEMALVIDRWNQLERIGINPIVKITPTSKRHKNLLARIREFGIDEVLAAIERIERSEFLRGNNKRGWIINFDWFVLPSNFQKVLEGNYDSTNANADGSKRTVFDEWRDA